MPIEEQSMDKKIPGKLLTAGPGKCNQDPKLKQNQNSEYNAATRVGRGRRSHGPPAAARLRQSCERRARPAPTGAQHSHREQVATGTDAGSGHIRGSKKGYQDASYLVNFRCETARDRHAERYSAAQWQLQRAAHHQRPNVPTTYSRVFRPRHVKEQYLQARCQFVVRDDGHYADNLADPDRLVDWCSVEQVWLHEDEPTTCPICLYPPVAARVTRCGHTYCAACLLHYLALSDHASRRCPICEEAVHPDQVRRCVLVPRPPVRPGDTVTFRLMWRRRESLLGQPADAAEPWEELISLADPADKQRLAKLVLATPEQVSAQILAPERAVLERQLAELQDEPEACFVQQALALLADDEAAAGERAVAAAGRPRRPDPATARQLATPLPAAAADSIVYECAFDEQTVEEAAAAEMPPSAGVRCRSVSETSGCEVTAADLEVVTPRPPAADRRHEHQQPLYYYQAEDGQPVFLHALNCRMLLSEHGGAWERCPRRLTADLLDVDSVTMTAGFRQRLRSLRHLPLTSQLQVVEVRLQPPDVSERTIAQFRDQLKKREQRRRDKQRRERQHERRGQHQHHDQSRHQLHQHGRRRESPGPAAVYDTAFPASAEAPAEEKRDEVVQEPEEEEEEVPRAAPSFAQLLRAGSASRRVWPVQPPAALQAPAVKVPTAERCVDSEGDAAPSYSDSWSAGLAAALEQADRGRAGRGADEHAKPKGRKGKKGKTVLISGGLNF